MLVEHVQLLAVVLALPLRYPQFVQGLLQFCGSIMGGLGRVYAPSCLLPAGASSFDAAVVDLMTQLLVSLVVLALLPASVLLWWVQARCMHPPLGGGVGRKRGPHLCSSPTALLAQGGGALAVVLVGGGRAGPFVKKG